MKLTVLGGSAASMNAGQGCSAYLVSHLKTNVVLDLGPGTLLELRKHTDYRALSGIVISHLHLDHILDLFALRFALAYNPIEPQGPVPLYLPPGGEAFLRAMASPAAAMEGYDDYFEVFTIREYDPEQALDIEELHIAFAPTIHALPTWAMRITGQGESRPLLYTADTGPTTDFTTVAQDVHVLLVEATYGIDPDRDSDDSSQIHMTVGQATELATTANARALVLTHTLQELSPQDYVAAARGNFGGNVMLAKPGLEVAWEQA